MDQNWYIQLCRWLWPGDMTRSLEARGREEELAAARVELGRPGLAGLGGLSRAELGASLRHILSFYVGLHHRFGYQHTPGNELLFDYLFDYLRAPGSHPPCLLLGAGVGAGKTTLLLAFRHLLLHSPYMDAHRAAGRDADSQVRWVDSRRLAALFRAERREEQEDDYRVKLGHGPFSSLLGCGFLFVDDMGVEPPVLNHYGTEYRLLEDLLSCRYERRLPTFVSTNLGPGDILARYGGRLTSRMQEQYRFIVLTQGDFREFIRGRHARGDAAWARCSGWDGLGGPDAPPSGEAR